jgi:hypothetical protein
MGMRAGRWALTWHGLCPAVSPCHASLLTAVYTLPCPGLPCRDKRVVREPNSEADIWWGAGSPNYEMDER